MIVYISKIGLAVPKYVVRSEIFLLVCRSFLSASEKATNDKWEVPSAAGKVAFERATA
jgi:hypothetical protein